MKHIEITTLATFYKLQKEAGITGQLIYPLFKEFTGFNGLYLLPEQSKKAIGVFQPRIYATCDYFNGVYLGISNINNSKGKFDAILISLVISEKIGTDRAISNRLELLDRKERISDIYIEIPALIFNSYNQSSLVKKRMRQIKTIMCLSEKSVTSVKLNNPSVIKQILKECRTNEDVARRFGRTQIEKIVTFVSTLRGVILTPERIIDAMR